MSQIRIDEAAERVKFAESVRERYVRDGYAHFREFSIEKVLYFADEAEWEGWLAAKRAVLSEAKDSEDAARLDWLATSDVRIVHSRDGEVCTIWRSDEGDLPSGPFWGYPQRWFDSIREAIDAAKDAT